LTPPSVPLAVLNSLIGLVLVAPLPLVLRVEVLLVEVLLAVVPLAVALLVVVLLVVVLLAVVLREVAPLEVAPLEVPEVVMVKNLHANLPAPHPLKAAAEAVVVPAQPPLLPQVEVPTARAAVAPPKVVPDAPALRAARAASDPPAPALPADHQVKE